MNKITSAALFFLAAGILTSVSILSVYQILFAIPLIYYTYIALKNKEVQLPKSAYWLIAFMVIALISLILNFEIIPKPSKNFGRLKYYLYGVGGILVLRSWLATASDKTKKILANVFLFSIIIAGIVALQSYDPSIPKKARAKGLTDTMRYGYGSGMLLLTLLGSLINRKKISQWFDWRIGICAFIIGFTGMYFTFTRGALLGFLCGLPFVLYFYKAKYGYYFGSFAVIVIAILSAFYVFGDFNGKNGTRFIVSKNNGSDAIRRSQWQAAVIATKEKPLLGWGLSNFHTQLKRIKNDYDLETKYYDDAHAHNLFLEVASGTGLIGLFFFIGWILTWALEAFQKDNLTKSLIIPFCVSWIISSQFEVTFDANNASMIFFLYSISSVMRPDVKS